MKELPFFTLFFLSLTLCITTAFAQTPIDGYEVIDNEYGLKITVPSSIKWDVKVQNTDAAHLIIREDSQSCEIQINEYTSTMKTPQEVHDKEISFIQNLSPDTKFYSKGEKLTIGTTADAISMTFKYAGSDEAKRKVFFQRNGKIYEILFRFKEDKFAYCKDDFSSMFKNIEFFEPNQNGAVIKDFSRGFGLKAPSPQWTVASFGSGLFLDYTNPETRVYESVIKIITTNHSSSSLPSAFTEHVQDIKNGYKQAQIKIENETVKLNNQKDALSITYVLPDKQQIKRDIVFLHRAKAMELSFSVLEDSWTKHKDGLKNILNDSIMIF